MVVYEGEVWVGSWNGLYWVCEGGEVEGVLLLVGKGWICYGLDGVLWSLVGSSVMDDLSWIVWDESGEYWFYVVV